MNDAYAELERSFAELNALENVSSLLTWDRETVMPPGAAEGRADQLAVIARIRHGKLADPALADRLDAAERAGGLDPWQAANLGLMRRAWRHATALDERLVEALTRAESRALRAWSAARPAADFAAFLPAFSDLVALTREAARAKAAALDKPPWESLLDSYEPSLTGADIDRLFDRLAARLPELCERVMASQARRPPPVVPRGPFPAPAQRRLAGFDFDRGRLDTSAHPFTGGARGDVRVTIRYDEDDFTSCVMAVMHETGHALYEFGLPQAWNGQPVGEAANMSVHESQSLLIEMQACRSREFLGFAAPLIAEELGGEGPAFEAGNLYRLGIGVAPGPVRVDADEVTYPLHIILRTRLERALVAGDLAPAELPGAWDEGMRGLLGIAPPNDRLGCLQDIHWAVGAFGYFPTYTLGALAAAQLFAAATARCGDILPGLGRGDFAPLVDWLRGAVHAHGARLSTRELLLRATGAPLSSAAFEAHLQRRYLD